VADVNDDGLRAELKRVRDNVDHLSYQPGEYRAKRYPMLRGCVSIADRDIQGKCD